MDKAHQRYSGSKPVWAPTAWGREGGAYGRDRRERRPQGWGVVGWQATRQEAPRSRGRTPPPVGAELQPALFTL